MIKIAPAILGIATAIFLIFAIKSKTTQNIPIPTSSPQVKAAKLVEYTDPAGFSFKYGDDISIEKKDDPVSYANLALVTPTHAGYITILATDDPSKTIDDYLKKKNVTAAKKIKLAELDARQYESAGHLVTVALDTGVLFTITTDFAENKEYWTSIDKTLENTFAFKPPEKPAAQTPSGDSAVSDVEYDGEETVE